MFSIAKGFSIATKNPEEREFLELLDAILIKSFGPLAIGNPSAIQNSFLAGDDPVGDAGAFYERLNTELMFEFMPNSHGLPENVFESLVDRGVNMVDACLQGIKMPALKVSSTRHLVPTLTSSAIALADRAGGQHYAAAIQRLDQIYTKVLQLECFAPDLASRRGYPRVYSGQHLAIPLNNPRSRVFALVLNSDNPIPYIAASPLMQDCMEHWFEESRGLEGGYLHFAVNDLLNHLEYTNREIEKHSHFDVESDAFSSVGIRGLAIRIANQIATLDLRTDVPLGYAPPLPEDRWYSVRLNRKTEMMQIASGVMACGSFRESQRVLQSFFRFPEDFVRLMVMNETPQDLAFAHFSHALGSYLLTTVASHDRDDLLEKIDMYREMFIAAGYPDLKGTRALDTLCLDIEHGEFFHARGYLRTEEMHLGAAFCSRGYPSRYSSTQADDAARRERKVTFAFAMGQTQMLLTSARHMLDRNQPEGVSKDYEIPLLIQKFMNLPDFKPSQIIVSRPAFRRAMAMGLSSQFLLNDPAVADLMGDSIDSVLEDDLGL